jgi:hypothetical protein
MSTEDLSVEVCRLHKIVDLLAGRLGLSEPEKDALLGPSKAILSEIIAPDAPNDLFDDNQEKKREKRGRKKKVLTEGETTTEEKSVRDGKNLIEQVKQTSKETSPLFSFPLDEFPSLNLVLDTKHSHSPSIDNVRPCSPTSQTSSSLDHLLQVNFSSSSNLLPLPQPSQQIPQSPNQRRPTSPIGSPLAFEEPTSDSFIDRKSTVGDHSDQSEIEERMLKGMRNFLKISGGLGLNLLAGQNQIQNHNLFSRPPSQSQSNVSLMNESILSQLQQQSQFQSPNRSQNSDLDLLIKLLITNQQYNSSNLAADLAIRL